MKLSLKKQLHKKMSSKDKLYGTTTMGSRGQLVIPAQARKELGLNPGDQLVVMGKFGKVLGLVKTEAMAEFVETIMQNLSGTGMESEVQNHFNKIFGGLINKKGK
ncbi:MAG TPA: AbrB/MazE/SpoVT family DNA-binding domain-containing protein [Candidatus Limnocylindria bacterium]|nr:AbrB/MazE/SpoVT family DNA-binding domain-containing protein [Candidatus Limnocylindria bacterium]